ncbi:cupredoxin domain-containing protein [Streptomyces sp. MA5143a]|uniref:cupredoxin domain-containing protein n=1 Tax=Streptomyces sp. MA5143a TaxID=2083010 RepID=UPI000D199104|nr:cupredoxin domain-containing protein [Streptomyces sp. MA5143a]SPF02722.1 putative copper-binding protein [Streptomyces sp. MA5143a]
MTATLMTLMTFARRTVGPGLAAGALAGVLVACGGGYGNGGGSSPSAPGRSGKPGTTQVDVKLVDFKMRLSAKTLKAGAYTFVVKNDGHHDHAMEIEGSGTEQKTRTLAPGESANLTVSLKDGTYEVYCPVDGHKDLGMKTELTVGGSASTGTGTHTTDGHGY